jgi:hypothetical protein
MNLRDTAMKKSAPIGQKGRFTGSTTDALPWRSKHRSEGRTS